jgi:methylenetetrahydrofolate dehydrogenase (NADP+) / methenyltetrahydrofolate cyclohydrolase
VTDSPIHGTHPSQRRSLEPGGRGVLLDGKAIGAELQREAAVAAAAFQTRYGRPPGLAAVLVGDDPASQVYVASKTRSCLEAGLAASTWRLPADASQDELLGLIDQLNADEAVDGLLVQIPLPAGLSASAAQERVSPAKDVDGLHPTNVGQLWSGQDTLASATPSGILELLDRYGVELDGKRAVVVGRSNIVGKPMAALLLQRNCTVTLCHSRTRDLSAVCREADVLVAAIGRAGLLGPDHVREGAVVIDVGTNRITDPAEVERLFPGDEAKHRAFAGGGEGFACDVCAAPLWPHSAAITPVPGGVGPLTVAMVIQNTVKAAERRLAAGAAR